MDAFEALGYDGLHSKQTRSFRGPIARRTGAVFLAGDDDERHFRFLIFHRGVVDAHLFAIRLIDGDTAFFSGHHQVLDAHVRKGAAHHHLMVAATRTVAVEIANRYAAFLQIDSRGRGRFDCTGGGDVIGRDWIAEDGPPAGVVKVFHFAPFRAQTLAELPGPECN